MLDLRPAQGPRIALQLASRDNGLDVRVVESPVGEAAASAITLPTLDEVQRLMNQPGSYEQIGRGLFQGLFSGSLGELYRAALAAASGQILSLELRFDRDLVSMARYPWELLHDGSRYLLQTGAVNLARYLTFPEPPRPLQAKSPLRLLLISARPKDQVPLVSEFEALQTAFQALIGENKLDLVPLKPPTWDAFMDWLIKGVPSVLHFEGHGAYTQTGLLIFENADGESDPVEAATLANALYGSDLRLAVLSACDSSKAAGESLLGSVAPSLILAGIPAVIAMQQRLSDEAANRFSRGFYHALLAGQDIESAVAAGRKQLIRTYFWHVPTLYLRTRKQPEITQAYLERRIDTAGPKSAPINQPLRFGLWIRRTDSPKPSTKELRRLLGLEPDQAITRDSTRAPVRFPVEVREIKPGLVDVRVIAPDCDFHTSAVKQVSVFPDFDTPPLWFSFTPRRAGRLEVIFELTQEGAFVASVAHTIQVTESVEGIPVASVKSHEPGEKTTGWLDDATTTPGGVFEPPIPAAPKPVPPVSPGSVPPPPQAAPEPEPESAEPQPQDKDVLEQLHDWIGSAEPGKIPAAPPPWMPDIDDEQWRTMREEHERKRDTATMPPAYSPAPIDPRMQRDGGSAPYPSSRKASASILPVLVLALLVCLLIVGAIVVLRMVL